MKLPLILMADDSSDDCKIMRMALKKMRTACALKTVSDGEKLLQTLKGLGEPLEKGERPDLIVLDLNMPGMGGLETLKEIKSDASLRMIPVVVWSTSDDMAEIMKCYKLGAASFFVKPDSLVQVVTTMRVVTEYWFKKVSLPA